MSHRLFVGGLPYAAKNEELRELFEPHGAVQMAEIIMDKATGRSKGFGFVEMETEESAKQAITDLDGTEFQGRNITVSIAKPKVRTGGGDRGGRPGGDRGGRPRY